IESTPVVESSTPQVESTTPTPQVESSTVVTVRNFDLDPIINGKRSTCSVIIGGRCCGKTSVAKKIILSDKFSQIHIIQNPNDNEDSAMMNDTRISYYEKYDEKILTDVIHSQRRMPNDDRKHAMILIEDSSQLSEKRMEQYDSLKYIFINGSFLKISLVWVMQYPMSIPYMLRCNLDYAFIFRRATNAFTEKTYRMYVNVFPNDALYKAVIAEVTQNYGCLVIDYQRKSNKLEDKIFWYNSRITQ
ncbi:MAG: hypothetical protein WD512_14680, partial [Candidatus Paceibacterota bacterium]